MNKTNNRTIEAVGTAEVAVEYAEYDKEELAAYLAEVRETAEKNGMTFVHSKFETMGRFKNVLIKVPARNSDFMKEIHKHTLWVAGDEYLEEAPIRVEVPNHHCYCSVHGTKRVFRHFYKTEAANFGQTIIAEVEVMLKTDFSRQGEKSLSLDIVQLHTNGRPAPAEWKLKIGVGTNNEDNGSQQIQIPGTNQFICFEKISRK